MAPEEGGEVVLGPRLEPAREPAHGLPPEVGAAGLVPWQSPGEVLGLGLRSPSGAPGSRGLAGGASRGNFPPGDS